MKKRSKPQGFGCVLRDYRLTIYNYCGSAFDCTIKAENNQDANIKATALLAVIANPDRNDFSWAAYKFFGDSTPALQEFGLEMRSLPEGEPSIPMLKRMIYRFFSIDAKSSPEQIKEAGEIASELAKEIRSCHWWALLKDRDGRPLKDYSNFVALSGMGRWEEAA